MDKVRVLRIIEYVGPRIDVERQINNSIHGTKQWGKVTMHAVTLGSYPEIMEEFTQENSTTEYDYNDDIPF